MARILAALAAAVVVALALTPIQTHAEPQPEPQAGQPLKLTPTFRPARHVVERPAIGRPSHRIASSLAHRAHPMARPMAARHNPPVTLAGDSRGVDDLPAIRGEDGHAALRGQETSALNTTGLIGLLPWWRTDPMETIRYLDREANSGVLAAADAWLFPPPATQGHFAATGIPMQRVATDEASEYDPEPELGITEANELNAIDLLSVAVAGPRMPSEPWLQAWLAMLAGALAAAATARFLFS
jgi:hypothetical protein